jgi:hypothetical protein
MENVIKPVPGFNMPESSFRQFLIEWCGAIWCEWQGNYLVWDGQTEWEYDCEGHGKPVATRFCIAEFSVSPDALVNLTPTYYEIVGVDPFPEDYELGVDYEVDDCPECLRLDIHFLLNEWFEFLLDQCGL